jgi:hypothetical protein
MQQASHLVKVVDFMSGIPADAAAQIRTLIHDEMA